MDEHLESGNDAGGSGEGRLLAAQAGVRYGINNPHAYIDANIVGTQNVLEGCRHTGVAHLVLGGLAVRLDLTIENLEDLQLALDALLGDVTESEVSDGALTVISRSRVSKDVTSRASESRSCRIAFR